MFNEADFAYLQFLEGRWKGIGPDGKAFFEEYLFESPTQFRSCRYADSTFGEVTDGSMVSLDDGQVISTWGPFSWTASLLSPTKACFNPLEAPSSFCWERMTEDLVTVTQRWTDGDGQERSYVLELNRVKA